MAREAAPTRRPRHVLACLLLWLTAAAVHAQQTGTDYVAQRKALISQLRSESSGAGNRPALDEQVLQAMGRVPRHEFVPKDQQPHAYEDRPLAIGHQQTISQPFIVALMTTLLRVERGDKILEVGTGSGYQAAVLAELGAQVHTIEILEPLGAEATQRLKRYPNVETRIGDGYLGWPEQAPFDGIVVTAAASPVPPLLVEQLKPGGRMVIPLGSPTSTQQLVVIEKGDDGRVRSRRIIPVRFVPLTGEH